MWVVLSEVEMCLIMVLLPGCSVSITFSRIMKIFWLKNLPACIISFFWVFFFGCVILYGGISNFP